jgi:hypothetical protein
VSANLPEELVQAATELGLVRGQVWDGAAWWIRADAAAAMAFLGDDGVWRWAPEGCPIGHQQRCGSEQEALERAVAWLQGGGR